MFCNLFYYFGTPPHVDVHASPADRIGAPLLVWERLAPPLFPSGLQIVFNKDFHFVHGFCRVLFW